jgi:acetyl-CoA carboxylase alpha subunit
MPQFPNPWVVHIVEQLDNLQQLPLEDLLNKRYQRLMSYGT